MKLIVDIDDETYETIKNAEPLKWDCPIESAYVAIKNGTPLDDIKAEIENEIKVYSEETDYFIKQHFDGIILGLKFALKDIDKHISGKE